MFQANVNFPTYILIRQNCVDIFQLMKPRIVLLLAITSMAGYLLATKGNSDLFNVWQFIWSTLGLSLSAGGANMINMWFDADIDCVMKRTKNRPIPAGRIKKETALYWGVSTGLFSTIFLWYVVNFWAAMMALFGYLFYVFIYTMWLKRKTVQNIVIGGAAGAFPPLVGWAAVQGNVADPLPWLMFAIIFLWTPPHFWALALMVNIDYKKAGVPMLPAVKGVAESKIQIVYYLVALILVTFAIGFLPIFGFLYLSVATILGGWWLYLALKLLYEKNVKYAENVFIWSLYYLAFLFLAMVLDVWL